MFSEYGYGGLELCAQRIDVRYFGIWIFICVGICLYKKVNSLSRFLFQRSSYSQFRYVELVFAITLCQSFLKITCSFTYMLNLIIQQLTTELS